MSKQESPLSGLSAFIPGESLPEVVNYLQQYSVHLTITRERRTILGNYRSRLPGKNHRITVNGNLNKYSFLITLLHELAHLLTYEKYGVRISPHGVQWKSEFAKILSTFISSKIFPSEIETILLSSLKNPAASSCADVDLTRALKKYDNKSDNIIFVEQLNTGANFKIKGGRVFKKGERIKKRFKCKEVATGKVYLFSPVHEVEEVKEV